jgi:transcriptional regulator with XRE-family HTH domain
MARASQKIVEVDELTIDGRNIRVQHAELDVDAVKLNPRNPRIANTVGQVESDDSRTLDKHIEEVLWGDSDVRELCSQIEVNKGLIERIVARPDGLVLEGNCRTVCYRKLKAKNPGEGRWKRIPARILPADISPRDVAILLGEMHVAGKNTWSPFEKAGHIHAMHVELGLTQDEIAKRLRMSKSRVNQLVRAFEAVKYRLLPRFPRVGGIRKFSYFEEFYRNPVMREWASRDARREDQFVEWVGTGKLSEGVQVRSLPSILAAPEAVRALSKEGFEAAMSIVGESNPALESKLLQKMVDMTELLRTARLDDVRRVSEHRQAQAIVKNMADALEQFSDLAGLKGRKS